MAVVGPGSIQQNIVAPKPTLEGASEYEYVTVHNPLSDDFAVQVAQDIPINAPFELRKDGSGRTSTITNTEQDARQVYGLNLKNPDFQGRKHILNQTVIPAGGTLNFRGNEAQVAVRQLVDEILQREGKTRKMADPVVRQEVESRVVQRRGNIQELMDGSLTTPQQQATQALNLSNEVSNGQTGTVETPEAGGSQEAGAPTPGAGDQQSPKPVGRPKKADS